jgi:hypothetical protein
MGQSYRIKTELGANKTIDIQLDQEFEFLEILSLKIQQSDVYTRSCADYGVLVGRVTANNGLGVPNARISVFIPVTPIDESNPLISSIYPYKSPSDKNEDGYRYNLLPYEKSYSKHSATGTLPTRSDTLTGSTAVEIFDTYYKYTAKTNESGDYMIMGVPLGEQTIVMDVDLSDIGEFSLTPQDLIRMGLASEAQVAGSKFRSSTDLNSLPQIINLTKNVDVSPLWGDPTVCQIAVNRLDFDLRDDANVDIQPTSVFMGSIFSTPDSFRIRKNCRPRDNMGNLCELQAGPGQILAIRQTTQQDEDGNPVLEQYELEQSGNVIDGDGTWLIEVPMNLDYLVTNEFGEKVVSNNPTLGVPTRAKYRFKIKWTQNTALTEMTRRAYFLVPNVKEYGWSGTTFNSTDPNYLGVTTTEGKQLGSSYYFGLAWSGYTDGFISQRKIDRLNDIIDCNDTFYQFEYNKVYTVSGLIDEYKNGFSRGRFLGIKEIDSQDCDSTVNKFPVNDGVRNFDLIYFLFSIIFQVIQLFGVPLLVIYHFIAFLWNNFSVPFLAYLIVNFTFNAINYWSLFAGAVAGTAAFGATAGQIAGFIAQALLYTAGVFFLTFNFRKIVKYKFGRFKIPMITYPDCQACDCEPETTSSSDSSYPNSTLTQLSNNGLYYEKMLSSPAIVDTFPDDGDTNRQPDRDVAAVSFSQTIGTRTDGKDNNTIYKSTESDEFIFPVEGDGRQEFFSYSNQIPLGERINVFNTRKKYFDGVNKISVTFDVNSNFGKNHFDNTITILTSELYESGELLTFVNPESTTDINYLWTGTTINEGLVTGISGIPIRPSSSNLTIEYAVSQTTSQSLTYFLSSGSIYDNYKYPLDIEYYQVITGITVSDAMKLWSLSTNTSYFPKILMSQTDINWNLRKGSWGSITTNTVTPSEFFTDFDNQYITILQRGVDPYSPKYVNQYGLGKIFGLGNESDLTITASTRLNIPIQKLTTGGLSVQKHTQQNNIYNPSYFFLPGDAFSAFTTSNVGYYGALDGDYGLSTASRKNIDGVFGVVTKTSNESYYSLPDAGSYDLSEDLSGAAYYYNETIRNAKKPKQVTITYNSPSLYPTLLSSPMLISTKSNNIMRTDRLPSSDYLDSSEWSYNPALLQQNLGFTVYIINTDTEDFTSERFGSGAQTYSPDVEGQLAADTLESFDCTKMVGLKCYSGDSVTFGIKDGCKDSDTIENGCYVFMERPLVDLTKDLKSFGEWGYRFRFFYGLCRGVLSQMFVNNWVNGTLYTYPIQVDTYYDSNNKPLPPEFCKDLIYFDRNTNNFYYRSSPYNDTTNRFVGKSTSGQRDPINSRNLLYPTTIVNLGIKDSFYSEITFDPTTKGYIMDNLESTSYSDMSDLVNLFVISRITDEKFLAQLFAVFNKNNSLDQLFTRNEKRIDGDLAQLMSINSEEGVINFSPEYYSSTGSLSDPVVILAPNSGNVTMGVFFSSTTEDLQFKDYLTPGRINFRGTNNQLYPYPYGIKSQVVPFYQWKLNNTNTIFGDQYNSWATNTSDIFSREYQSLDRTSITTPSYFKGSNTSITDTFARGYIFNTSANSPDSWSYSINAGQYPNKFLVGAPFHFYFGLIKGSSALDKFKTKYSLNE